MSKLIFFCLLLLLPACGDTVKDVPTDDTKTPEKKVETSDIDALCDGSEDLVFAFRVDDPHSDEGEIFYVENGLLFFYLNGKCEYWVTDFLPWRLGGGLRRLGPRRGILGKEEGIKFLEEIKWTSWSQIDKIAYTGAYTDRYVVFSKHMNFESLFSYATATDEVRMGATAKARAAGQIRFDIATGLHSQIKKLWEAAAPVKEGDVRIYVENDQDNGLAWEGLETQPIFMDWPLAEKSVVEVSKDQNPPCFGKSYLVRGEEANAFRNAREQYRAQTPDIKFVTSFIGVIDENGKRRRLYIREVLPFENEIGLVEFSGIGEEVVCP